MHALEIPTVSRDELWLRIERGAPLVLVDALSPMSFAHSHLPGAINLPPESVDEQAPRRIPDRTAEVVVYCANESCDSSLETAERLLALGDTNGPHYQGGKKEWLAGSLPVERGKANRSPRIGE